MIEPSLETAGDLLAANIAASATRTYDLHGRTLGEVSAQARQELLVAAHRYTSAYRDAPAMTDPSRMVLAGHQPTLFHPGVWLKNFALGRLGAEYHAAAVNLLVDSDTLRHATLRVPGGTPTAPFASEIAYDRPTAEIPYEERAIGDRALLSSFPRRVAEQFESLVADPFLHEFWPRVLAASKAEPLLGACLARARHAYEGELGLNTLELPQSEVCGFESFHWFTAHLLAELPRFQEVYNTALWEYRRVNRIRSTSHPVPELERLGDLIEAPFWIWEHDAPRRKRLFVSLRQDGLLLTDRGEIWVHLPLGPDGDLSRAVERLAGLAQQGIKLRGRALLTTLFARLFLSDLFLHGIGGAKYDELTDLIVQRFFGFEPPRFMIVSGTLKLPIPRPHVTENDLRRVDHELRDLTYHPEQYLVAHESAGVSGAAQEGPVCTKCATGTHVALTPELASLTREKHAWLAIEPTLDNARQRCREIRRLNETMQPWVDERRRELLAQREQLVEALRIESILGSREFAFCLYPAKTLWNFLLEFGGGRP
ncbi:MAG: hypothetical protein KF708_10790 [Pirellulales bacterium]|nr:hypothetical protein [Pirellulales bacterium]